LTVVLPCYNEAERLPERSGRSWRICPASLAKVEALMIDRLLYIQWSTPR
jgi:hypothetical protein